MKNLEAKPETCHVSQAIGFSWPDFQRLFDMASRLQEVLWAPDAYGCSPGELSVVQASLTRNSGWELTRVLVQVHAKDKPIPRGGNSVWESDALLHRVAELTIGMAGADLANLLNEASILMVRPSSCFLASLNACDTQWGTGARTECRHIVCTHPSQVEWWLYSQMALDLPQVASGMSPLSLHGSCLLFGRESGHICPHCVSHSVSHGYCPQRC